MSGTRPAGAPSASSTSRAATLVGVDGLELEPGRHRHDRQLGHLAHGHQQQVVELRGA
jgi:hypothetical protein